MDKTHKLQRYDRKDYSELVDFPVEIVGRDSVVRRYSFEDSIRLYQRRISCAPIRHRDPELIEAEVVHCRARVEQLRRSYFHRYGWGTPEGAPGAEKWFGDLSGELAAFLCRVFSVEGRPEVSIDPVEPEHDGVSTWYVVRRAEGPGTTGMLLYLHRFEGTAADAVRERFFTVLKELDRTGRGGGDAEKLLAFHHTMDCGFVLTGRGGDFAAFVPHRDESLPPVEVAPTPWDELLETVRRGDHDAAVRRCRELVREQPWHRHAYVAGALLSTAHGDHLSGEDLAFVGTRYFPSDGVLRYYLALCRLRLGRAPEGEAGLREALALAPDVAAARLLLALLLVRSRRGREAGRLLRDGERVEPDDRKGGLELENLGRWVRWRRAVTWGAALLVITGLALLVPLVAVGASLAVVGIGLAVFGALAFQRQLDAIDLRQRYDEIAQGMRRLQRRPPDRAVS
jgi:hypothetical protein